MKRMNARKPVKRFNPSARPTTIAGRRMGTVMKTNRVAAPRVANQPMGYRTAPKPRRSLLGRVLGR